jgi:TolB protein
MTWLQMGMKSVSWLLVASTILGADPTLACFEPSGIRLKPPVSNEENPLRAVFVDRDSDASGGLSEAEYVADSQPDSARRKRDFLVFDADGNQQLSLDEFLTIPMGQSEIHRGVINDPVIRIAESRLTVLLERWGQWDKDSDTALDREEFTAGQMAAEVPGLQYADFSLWDQDKDSKISPDDVARTLEIAYGIRTPAGDLLRNNAGRVVDWVTFRALKVDGKGMVSKGDYFAALGGIENKEGWFGSIDKNLDGQFDFAEFSQGDHRTDPVQTFLNLDTDLNGVLSRAEIEALPADWKKMASFAFTGFDDNHDGAISLSEYQLMPHCNLLASWMSAVDTNDDGLLLQFRLLPGIPLAALSAEYFQRLDVDHDKALSLSEFSFVTNHRPPAEIRVQYEDGRRKAITFPGFGFVCSPEISPDNKWVAADGWERNQMNRDAHVLVASLETDEIRDLGVGCMPNWSADGKRIAYCRYGEGVFIRSFEEDSNEEELIDRAGWAIQFSADGLHVAYVKRNDLIIQNVATGEKRAVFAAGNNPYRYIEHNIEWSPDSSKIVFRGHRTNGDIDVATISTAANGPDLKVCCSGADVAPDFTWQPDGQKFLFPRQIAGQLSQIYEVTAEKNQQPVRYALQPEDRSNSGLDWSRDGKVFSFMSDK